MGSTAKWDAGLYDEKHSFVWKMAAGLVELLEPKPGEHILDVGCGTGHLTAQIAASGAFTCGIDQSPEMIRQAREKFPELRFEVMDAREISLEKSFDAVLSNATLHWIKEPELVIRGIARILRPGGRFVAEFGGKGNIAGLMEAAEKGWKKLLPGTPFESPWFYPGVAEYANLLERHGLEVTYALLFDRPTPLEDGERGLRTWLEMFGGRMTDELPKDKRERLLEEITRQARGKLFKDGQWVMDYRRLRIVARKLHPLVARGQEPQ